ncbi:uncharacterized protein [Arachis hypogaea]|uniref:Uncharacterized protein n=1 Tax=Arachis hypogaea TaxID=3818 RepID=A0A445ES18_ARAHY|nr:hypothetical protein Ahy_A01g003025 [Arachis hypogaea]
MANPSSYSSFSSQFTYSSDLSYFPTPFHLQQPPYAHPRCCRIQLSFSIVTPPPIPARHSATLPARRPDHHPRGSREREGAIASSDVNHKTDTKLKAVPHRAVGQTWEDPSLAEWPEN